MLWLHLYGDAQVTLRAYHMRFFCDSTASMKADVVTVSY